MVFGMKKKKEEKETKVETTKQKLTMKDLEKQMEELKKEEERLKQEEEKKKETELIEYDELNEEASKEDDLSVPISKYTEKNGLQNTVSYLDYIRSELIVQLVMERINSVGDDEPEQTEQQKFTEE